MARQIMNKTEVDIAKRIYEECKTKTFKEKKIYVSSLTTEEQLLYKKYDNRMRQKKYNEENREKLNEKRRQYLQKQRELFPEKYAELNRRDVKNFLNRVKERENEILLKIKNIKIKNDLKIT